MRTDTTDMVTGGPKCRFLYIDSVQKFSSYQRPDDDLAFHRCRSINPSKLIDALLMERRCVD